MRVLAVVRLSDVTDEITSPERQRAKIENYAKLNEHDLAGLAEDLEVGIGQPVRPGAAWQSGIYGWTSGRPGGCQIRPVSGRYGTRTSAAGLDKHGKVLVCRELATDLFIPSGAVLRAYSR
jgi:hypothetical protein